MTNLLPHMIDATKPNGIPPNPFVVPEMKGGDLTIRIIGKLRDSYWGWHYAPIQKALEEKIFKEKAIEQCHFDFTECTWSDPTPLLSILMSIFNFVDNGDKSILTLPDPEGPGLKFLHFLNTEGFLDTIKTKQKINFKINNKDIQIHEIKQLLEDSENNCLFQKSKLLPASIIYFGSRSTYSPGSFSTVNQIKDWLERQEIIDKNIINELSKDVASNTIQVVKTVMFELLQNIFEHAYEGGGYGAIYLRYRTGLKGKKGEIIDNKEIADEFEAEQHSPNCELPYLESSYRHKSGFLELFVVDHGKGLCNTLGKLHGVGKNIQHICNSAFTLGKSTKKDRTTATGGLKVISELLTPQQDAFRVRDSNNWWGAKFPITSNNPSYRNVGKSSDLESPKGLSWTFRFSWDTEGTLDRNSDDNYQNSPNKLTEETAELALRLFKDSIDNSEPTIHAFDQRANALKRNSFIKHNLADKRLIWLPKDTLVEKNSIADYLINKIDPEIEPNGTLLIGDITADATVKIYIEALNKNENLKNINAVILITNDLQVIAFSKNKKNQLSIDKELFDSYVKYSDLKSEALVITYLRNLRIYDSRRFWNTLIIDGEDGGGYYFLKGKVEWPPLKTNGEKRYINGYLNFPETTTNPICSDIYNSYLQKLFSLLKCKSSNQQFYYEGMDSFTNSLARMFSSKTNESSAQKIIIGSVQVSGHIQNLTATTSEAEVIKCHFFRHPNATAETNYLLLWPLEAWFVDKPFTSLEGYERIGLTSAIAEDGWKYFELPRFDENDESVYVESPKNSYKAWQSQKFSIMKIGHWTYGGHHDFLTINLKEAFVGHENNFSALERFVYTNLIEKLNISEDLLTQEAIDRLKGLVKFTNSTTKPVLVYPSHDVTDYIIKNFFKLFKNDDIRKNIRSRIISILPIKTSRNGSTLLLSGLTYTRLEKRLQSADYSALIFDDAMLTGRTYHDIKRILKKTGYKNIYTLTLLDRQRLPSSDYIRENNQSYWRFDVPSLGSESSCLLCQALSHAENIKNVIIDTYSKKRISEIINEWQPSNPISSWAQGLKQKEITLKEKKKKFGLKKKPDTSGQYEQRGGNNEKIEIVTSTGLVAYISELHSMTSRDDLPLAILNKPHEYPLEDSCQIELIVSQLLLFPNEFDETLAIELTLRLFEILSNLKGTDKYTGLAMLALLSSKPNVIKTAYARHYDSLKNEDQINVANLDYIHVVASLVHKGFICPNSNIERACRLLRFNQEIFEAFDLFHLAVKDMAGKSHSAPMHRFIDGVSHDVYNAISSAKSTLELAKVIVEERARSRKDRKEIIDILGEAERLYIQSEDQSRHVIDDANEANKQIFINTLKEYIAKLDNFHTYFYLELKFGNNDNCPVINKLNKLINEISSTVPFRKIITEKKLNKADCYDKPAYKLLKNETQFKIVRTGALESRMFIFWDDLIENSIKDLLVNAVYATKKIDSEYDMRVTVNESESDLEIKLENIASDVHKSDLYEKSRKHRCFPPLNKLKITLDYDVDNETVQTMIRIPYPKTLTIKSLVTTGVDDEV